MSETTEALDWSIEQLRPFIEDGKFKIVDEGPMRDVLWHCLGLEWTQSGGVRLDDFAAEHLFMRAFWCPDGYDLCCDILLQNVRVNETIPEAIWDFARLALKHGIRRPKRKKGKKGPSRFEGWARNAMIVWLVDQLRIHLKIAPTRNDVSPPLSGCDIVAEAFEKCGVTDVTFRSAKRAWLDKRIHEDIELIGNYYDKRAPVERALRSYVDRSPPPVSRQ